MIEQQLQIDRVFFLRRINHRIFVTEVTTTAAIVIGLVHVLGSAGIRVCAIVQQGFESFRISGVDRPCDQRHAGFLGEDRIRIDLILPQQPADGLSLSMLGGDCELQRYALELIFRPVLGAGVVARGRQRRNAAAQRQKNQQGNCPTG